jgi:lipopolysaccharide/colanic/teichoic acid biosynthesis glycosyltransferase
MQQGNKISRIAKLIYKIRKKRFASIDAGFKVRYGYQFYTDDYFKHILSIERKRTERSGTPFMLMMIDVTELTRTLDKSIVHKTFFKFLGVSTREIDLKGWYKDQKIFGILFLEIASEKYELLIDKMKKAIKSNFTPEQRKLIEISCLVFPIDESRNENRNSGNRDTDKTDTIVLYPELTLKTPKQHINTVLKRTMDFSLGLCGLVCLLPLFTVIAAIIKMTSKGPVLFEQERLGLGGKVFKIYKFRTMYQNNNNAIHQRFVTDFIRGGENIEKKDIKKIQNDPRVTKIGKFLRKTSIDELPQLINVIIGNMSLVGPRPALAYEVDKYDTWHKRRVFEVKPGITGLWQVVGRSRTKFDDMVRLDICYIQKSSVLFDMKLLLQTPFSMLKGAY